MGGAKKEYTLNDADSGKMKQHEPPTVLEGHIDTR